MRGPGPRDQSPSSRRTGSRERWCSAFRTAVFAVQFPDLSRPARQSAVRRCPAAGDFAPRAARAPSSNCSIALRSRWPRPDITSRLRMRRRKNPTTPSPDIGQCSGHSGGRSACGRVPLSGISFSSNGMSTPAAIRFVGLAYFHSETNPTINRMDIGEDQFRQLFDLDHAPPDSVTFSARVARGRLGRESIRSGHLWRL